MSKDESETSFPDPPDWKVVFENDNPLKVEIGPGKGQFLIDLALREPRFNYVAVEIRRKRVAKIESKIARADLKNVRVCWGDARSLLPSLFSPGSVSDFFIHFPDPWPKRKHSHRRTLDANFAALLHDLLVPKGIVYLTTDVESYADLICNLFEERGNFETLYAGEEGSPYHRTIHEWKFKLQNRRIQYFAFSKRTEQEKSG